MVFKRSLVFLLILAVCSTKVNSATQELNHDQNPIGFLLLDTFQTVGGASKFEIENKNPEAFVQASQNEGATNSASSNLPAVDVPTIEESEVLIDEEPEVVVDYFEGDEEPEVVVDEPEIVYDNFGFEGDEEPEVVYDDFGFEGDELVVPLGEPDLDEVASHVEEAGEVIESIIKGFLDEDGECGCVDEENCLETVEVLINCVDGECTAELVTETDIDFDAKLVLTAIPDPLSLGECCG